MTDVLVLKETREAVGKEIAEAEKEALDSFLSNLPPDSIPTEDNIRICSEHAWHILKKRLLSPPVLRKLEIPESRLGQLAVYLNEAIRIDSISPPVVSVDFSAIRLGLAAGIGALLGMLVLEPITRYLLGLPGVGRIIGALIGSFVFVFVCMEASQKWAVKYGIVGAAVIGSVAQMTAFFRKRGGNWFRKLIIYPFIVLCIYLSEKRKRFDRDRYSEYAGQIISNWSATVVAVLALSKEFTGKTENLVHQDINYVGAKIVELHSAKLNDLPLVAYELIQEAKNAGFGGLDGEPAFLKGEGDKKGKTTVIWSEEMAKQFDTYGYVAVGDRVNIVKKPVIIDGETINRGLVRRERR